MKRVVGHIDEFTEILGVDCSLIDILKEYQPLRATRSHFVNCESKRC